MGAKATHCGSCGSPLEGAREVALVEESLPANQEDKAERRAARDAAAKVKEKRDNRKGCLIATPLFGGFLWFAAWMGSTEPVGMEAISQTWTRTIEIEKFGPVERGAWCGEVPSAGRVIKRESRVKETKRVQDGESCRTVRKDNGDGTYREEESCTPRYKEEEVKAAYCDYLIDDWSTERTLRSEGEGTGARSWPSGGALREGQCVGCEREGRRVEKLVVQFRATKADGDGKKPEGSCDVNEADYQKFKVGTHWSVGVRNMGGLACDEIQAPESAK
jgi:hypothetical protein